MKSVIAYTAAAAVLFADLSDAQLSKHLRRLRVLSVEDDLTHSDGKQLADMSMDMDAMSMGSSANIADSMSMGSYANIVGGAGVGSKSGKAAKSSKSGKASDDILSTGPPGDFGSFKIGFGQLLMPTSGRLGNFPSGYDGVIPLDIYFPLDPATTGLPATYVLDGTGLAAAAGVQIPEGCGANVEIPLNNVLQSLSFPPPTDHTQLVFPDPTKSYPLVLVSHGLGGTSSTFIDTMKKMASHGFVAIGVNHPGNTAVDAVSGSTDDEIPDTSCNRAKDIRDVISFMTNPDAKTWPAGFPVNIDPAKIAVTGHSFGSFAALSSVLGYGASIPGGGGCPFIDGTNVSLPDERVGVAIPMSPFTFNPITMSNLFTQAEIDLLTAGVLFLSSGEDLSTPVEQNVENIFYKIRNAQADSMRIEMTNGGHNSYVDFCPGSDYTDGLLALADAPVIDQCSMATKTLASAVLDYLGPFAVSGCPGVPGAQENLPLPETVQEITSTYYISYLKSQLIGEDAYKRFLEDDFAKMFSENVVDEIDTDVSVLQGGGKHKQNPSLTIMTRNMYVGMRTSTFFDPAGGAEAVLAQFQTTQFDLRVKALADEICDTKPDLISLQEVSTITVSGFDLGFGEGVPLKFLDVLVPTIYSICSMSYTPAIISSNVFLGPFDTALGQASLLDQDAILVNSGRVQVTGSDTGTFSTILQAPLSADINVPFLRSWQYVDATVGEDKSSIRFANTHLETSDPFFSENEPINNAQAQEFIDAVIHTTPDGRALIAAGDFNCIPSSTAYHTLSDELEDVWVEVNDDEDGFTCCQDGNLDNAVTGNTARIDYIFYHDSSDLKLRAKTADNIGSVPFQGENPLWASDHAGVVGIFELDKK